MKKKWLSLIPLFSILILTYFLCQKSITQATYQGLQTVPCINYTKSIAQDYSFHISISILGQNYPIPATLGHDYGQCLHEIFADDSSGKIYVKTNEKESFNLGHLFDVWHSTFNANQIFEHQTTNGRLIEVFLNGQKVKSDRQTLLLPNSDIKIIYK